MVVNVDFGRGANAATGSARKVELVAHNGTDGHARENVMRYRHRVNRLSEDLRSALETLSAANGEIDRLVARLEECTEEIRVLKNRIAELEGGNADAGAAPSRKGGRRRGKAAKDKGSSGEDVGVVEKNSNSGGANESSEVS